MPVMYQSGSWQSRQRNNTKTMGTLKKIEPNPEHPAYKKGRESALRGVMRPRTRFQFGPEYRENVIQFRAGRASVLSTLRA